MKSIVRLISTALLAVLLAELPITAVAEEDNRAAFRAAYAEYQELLEGGSDAQLADAAGRAYELGLKIFPEDSKNLPALAFNYGSALVDAGEKDAAVDVLGDAVDHYEVVYGKDSIELIPVLMQLGDITGKAFEAQKQRRNYRRALKLAEEHYGPRSDEYGQYSLKAGIGLLNESRSTDAQRFLEKGHEILLETRGSEDRTTGYAAFQVGRYHFARGNYRIAEEHLVAALQTFEDPDRPTSTLEVSAHAWLVSIYQELDDPEKGTAHCQAIGRMTPYDEDQDYLPLYRRAPRYPMSALRQGHQGFADVLFTVDDQGFVQDPEVIAYEGDGEFKRAAINAVKAFRYAPRFVDGEPVATAGVKTRITFKIED